MASTSLETLPHVFTEESAVGLTFDDGPDPVDTPRLLDILAAHHAPFFMIGCVRSGTLNSSLALRPKGTLLATILGLGKRGVAREIGLRILEQRAVAIEFALAAFAAACPQLTSCPDRRWM